MEDIKKYFYSKNNINYIQSKIKKTIYEQTNGKILLTVNQDDYDLKIVMDNIYNKNIYNEKYKNKNLKYIIYKLNKKVIDSVIPDMIVNLKHTYIKEFNNDNLILPYPLNVNNTGKKILPPIIK